MHIAFDEKFYHHHAIVEWVDYDEEVLVLIEYNNDIPDYINNLAKGLNKAKICERSLTFGEKNDIYEVLHDFRLPGDIIVERACFRLGEEDYNFVRLNCEHFANWCVEGEAYSEQVHQGVKNVAAGTTQVVAGTG